MKKIVSLIFASLAFGCAHEPAEPPSLLAHASQASIHFPNSTPITLAQKNYTNGLVAEAYAGLLIAYQENPDLNYLEYSAMLADQEIQTMRSRMQAKTTELRDANYVLETFFKNEKYKVNSPQTGIEMGGLIGSVSIFGTMPAALVGGAYYQKAKNEKLGLQKIKAEFVYNILRSEPIEKYSKEVFLPRVDQTKNAMLKIQPLLSSLISVPSPDYDRLLALKSKIQKQREIICELRLRYTSDIFIGPRVNLGDKLVFMARFDRPNIAGLSPWNGSLNSYWVDKLSTLFTRDYGEWITQSDEETRFKLNALVKSIKGALEKDSYADFQVTLDLLSNNKKGGNDLYWPE